jgi:hypothetical protein
VSRPDPSRLPDPDRLRPALRTSVGWTQTADVNHPYEARVDGHDWLIRLGDFPAEPLYTLLVDGAEIGSFDTWPESWTRPTS